MKKKRILSGSLLLPLLLVMLLGTVWAADQVNITILGTSDLHGRIYSWDYAIDTEEKASGLAKVATAVKEARAQNPNLILVDNGDANQDNMIDLFNGDKVPPMVAAMNAIKYDAIGLGNHEFNYGLDFLNRIIKGSKAPAISANIYQENGKRLVKPYVIIKRSGVKVALIGMTTPHIPRWEATTPDNFKGLTFTDPVQETKKVLAELKGKADVFIGVMHMSVDPEYGVDGSGIKAIAQANPELTAIIAGHAHSTINGDLINGVLIVEPAANGAKVSRIDLTLEKENRNWVVKAKKGLNVEVVNLQPDAAILAQFKYVHDKSIAEANIVIGKIDGDFLPGGLELLPGIPTAQYQDTALVDFINEVQTYYTKADVSAVAIFSPSSNLVKGDFKKKDVANIYKYTNTLIAVKVNGKQLKAYMEWSAQFYNESKPGDLTASFNEKIPGYNYDMFSGVNYEINIAAPIGKRITNLAFKGKPVTDDMTFTLALNNYRYSGLVKDGLFKESDKIYDSYEKLGDKGRIRDLIVEYVRKMGTVSPKLDNNWKVTGYNTIHPLQAEVFAKVKSGAVKIPASANGRTLNVKAVNVYELCDNGTLSYTIIDILSITDFHGTLIKSGRNPGMAALVNEIKKHKAANKNTLFVSAGDLFQGSAESNLLYGKPVVDSLKEAGMIASAIGNHEYDWGVERIPGWAKDGNFTFLGANIYDRKTKQPVSYVKPYIMVDVAGYKVAFIGLTTPETAYKTKPEIVKDVEFKAPLEVMPKYITEVAEQGASLIIALTHLGASQDKAGVITGEAAELNVLSGLDGIIAGHSHNIIAGKAGNVPLVMAYYNGRSIAKLSYIFAKSTRKPVYGLMAVDNLFERLFTLADNLVVKGIIDKYMAQIQPILSEKIGVAMVDLNHNTTKPSLMGEWVCEIMRKKTGAQISFQNGGGLRVSLPKGDLTMSSMYTLMPFDNTLVTAKLTGAQVKEAIENGLGNPKISFGQVSGVFVVYDLSRPFGDRVISMKLENGEVIDPKKLYTVVANDFMFSGGDNYVSLMKGKDIYDTGLPIREAIVEYVKAEKNINPGYKGYQMNVIETQVKKAS
jgi:2',3'-cyclic-nucleotide 2'-phosphodiesterase/3'-nucleotidase/5'-nucleotidase